MKKLSLQLLYIIATSLISAQAQSTNLPDSFNFDGVLTDNLNSPIADTVNFKIGVYNPAGTCLLYEETQSTDLTLTNGRFSLRVGSGAPTGSNPGLTMFQLFSNNGQVRASGANCSGGYTPNPGDGRNLKITIVTIGGTGVNETLTMQEIHSSPFAMVAETANSVQGLGASDLINVNGAHNLTQSNVESVYDNYSELMNIINGTSTLYVSRPANGSAAVPQYSGAPSSPLAGQMWYDSVA